MRRIVKFKTDGKNPIRWIDISKIWYMESYVVTSDECTGNINGIKITWSNIHDSTEYNTMLYEKILKIFRGKT